jgi:hypothetical protein
MLEREDYFPTVEVAMGAGFEPAIRFGVSLFKTDCLGRSRSFHRLLRWFLSTD